VIGLVLRLLQKVSGGPPAPHRTGFLLSWTHSRRFGGGCPL